METLADLRLLPLTSNLSSLESYLPIPHSQLKPLIIQVLLLLVSHFLGHRPHCDFHSFISLLALFLSLSSINPIVYHFQHSKGWGFFSPLPNLQPSDQSQYFLSLFLN